MKVPKGITEPAWLEIDLDALAFNVQRFKEHVGPCVRLMPVLKGGAHGAGAVPCAETALAHGADAVGVIRAAEAVHLRENGVSSPVLNLGFCAPREIPLLLEHDIIQTVHRPDYARQLHHEARRRSRTVKIHVNVDTGMCRGGMPRKNAGEFFSELKNLAGLKLEGVFTHFPTADCEDKSFALEQISSFREIMEMVRGRGFGDVIFHAANTAAAIDLPQSHFDMVRPGVGIYGMYGSPFVSRKLGLKQVVRFRAVVSHVKRVNAGTGVSYGLTYRTPRDTTIATIQAGYADGVTRSLSNTGALIIRGRKYRIAGRVTMDQIMVDLGPDADVGVMDVATLVGGDGGEMITMDDFAGASGSVAPEVQSRFSPRLPRAYLKQDGVERIMRSTASWSAS